MFQPKDTDWLNRYQKTDKQTKTKQNKTKHIYMLSTRSPFQT